MEIWVQQLIVAGFALVVGFITKWMLDVRAKVFENVKRGVRLEDMLVKVADDANVLRRQHAVVDEDGVPVWYTTAHIKKLQVTLERLAESAESLRDQIKLDIDERKAKRNGGNSR